MELTSTTLYWITRLDSLNEALLNFIAAAGLVFVPTTKEAFVIYGVPALAKQG